VRRIRSTLSTGLSVGRRTSVARGVARAAGGTGLRSCRPRERARRGAAVVGRHVSRILFDERVPEVSWTSVLSLDPLIPGDSAIIPWPSRGPNVGRTRGSAMRCCSRVISRNRANQGVLQPSALVDVAAEVACHAGGRGFESRRSRFLKRLQISRLRCQLRRDLSVSWPVRGPMHSSKSACKSHIFGQSLVSGGTK
jgi:hypothetical protein